MRKRGWLQDRFRRQKKRLSRGEGRESERTWKFLG